MGRRRAIFLGAAAGLCACRHIAVEPHRCATLERENDQALSVLPDGEPRRRLRDASRCVETPTGAWGLAMASITAGPDGVLGRWSLVHLDAEGARLAVAPDTSLSVSWGGPERTAPASNLEWSPASQVVPAAPVLFDFDGDGQPEAVVIVDSVETSEAGLSFHVRRGRVWSARAGKLDLYPPARDFAVEQAGDVDGDGRLDLVTHAPYAALATVKCGSEDPYPVSGPALLAHSIAGGAFSWSDAAAVAFARQECAVAPGPVLVAQRDHPAFVEFAASARNLACARLWGADGEALVAEVVKRCRQMDSCPTCDDPDLLGRWARLPPPLHLQR